MKKQHNPLTEQERRFAEEHHSMVFRYLARKGLPESEYYDIVVFGYLNGVQKYCRDEELRQQYSFSTIAWNAMNTCFFNHERDKARPKNRAAVLSLHESLDSPFLLEEMISDARDYAEETLSAMRIQETISSFEQTEREIVRLLMEGYAKSEVRRQLGLTAGQMKNLINHIQTKVVSSPLLLAA